MITNKSQHTDQMCVPRLALSAHAFQELPRREAQRELLESSYMSSYVSKL